MSNLAITLWKRGKPDEVEAINRGNLHIPRCPPGEEHPDTLWATGNLADLLEERGKPDEAEALRKESTEIRQRTPAEEGLGTQPALKPEGNNDSVAAAAGEVSVLAYDGFDGDFGLDWKTLNPDPSHYSLTKDPGALTITTWHGGLHGSSTDYENLFLTDCPGAAGGDFQLTTCTFSFKPVAIWNQAGLVFYSDDGNYLQFVYEWNFGSGGRIFTVGIETEGRFSTVHFRAH